MDEQSFIYFFRKLQKMSNISTFSNEDFQPVNRAFLNGDAVTVSFFVHHGRLIMAEECYFFLMASMRKLRMNIPLSYTLDFFQDLFQKHVLDQGIQHAVIQFMVYRNITSLPLHKTGVAYYFRVEKKESVLALQNEVELDLIKEININCNLLSNIKVHCAENTYAEIYARENGLDDVILLNPDKRIARAGTGNLIFLQGDSIKIPKHSEGAYISPLLENLVTFIHKNQLGDIQETELIAFESQKADEILLVSDEKGIFPVSKIRNKTFGFERFSEIIEGWKATL